jgi:hypothetical protein
MRTPLNSLLILVLGSSCAQGVVLVSFDDRGRGISAQFSGSLDLVGLEFREDDTVPGIFVGSTARSTTFVAIWDLPHDVYIGGDITLSGLEATNVDGVNLSFIGYTNITFGYSLNGVGPNNNALFVPGDTPLNGTIDASSLGSWNFPEETLADIGLGDLTTTPFTVWNNPNAEGLNGAIQFVRAAPIPEPGSSVLLGWVAFGLLKRRNR